MSYDSLQGRSTADLLRYAGIGALTFGLNYIIFGKLLGRSKAQDSPKDIQKMIISQVIQHEKSQIEILSSKNITKTFKKDDEWGSMKMICEESDDPLLKELRMMDSLLFQVSRVNNLIVDLELKDFKPYPNSLVAKRIKLKKQDPFLSQDTLLSPGEFVIKQCKFTPGNTIEMEKKYLRAGPRGGQFFKPPEVRADIVCLGNVCPGINTVIRELFIMLKNVYKVDKVIGVKNSFRGYYEKKFLELNEKIVETIHHYGGCYLGLSDAEFNADKIVDSLVERNTNQLYLIGGNRTMNACQALHKQIKKRKLAIAVCVLLKGINRDIPIFDSCFGFQTAVEESSKIIEKAYAFSHSFQNGISLIKLPGYNSGFLASHSVLSTVNSNICLVPEFQFDLYGPKGLLAAIIWRVKNKGSCTVVYSQGAENALRDCCLRKSKKLESTSQFDNYLREQIENAMTNQNLHPFSIGVFNATQVSKSAPANSYDTKLCCQIAQSSIMCMMSGYTNFAVGHLANKSAMISVDELVLSEAVTQLRQYDDIWQQTLMTTGQPRLLNDNFVIKTR